MSDSSSDVSSAEAPERVTQGTALKRPKVQYAGKRPPQKSYPSSSLFATEAEEDEDDEDLEVCSFRHFAALTRLYVLVVGRPRCTRIVFHISSMMYVVAV